MRGLAQAAGMLAAGAALVLVVVLAVALLTRAPADPALWPPEPGEGVAVMVVDHGFHAGLVIGARDLRAAAFRLARTDPLAAHALRAVAADYPEADWLEIGWGDEAFYRGAREMEDVTPGLVARALLWPSPSVLQVVPGRGDPALAFGGADRVRLELSQAGLTALAAGLAETFAWEGAPEGTPESARAGLRGPQPDGPSLYGAGAFYPGAPVYHALNTCNHWISALLRRAGVPSSWAFSATSGGLMAELGIRASAERWGI